jgi:hypothetical protein
LPDDAAIGIYPMTLRENETAQRRRISAAEAERRRQQREREHARQRAARREVATHDNRVLTFRQWCALNNFGLATKGPPVVQLSPRRIGIRESDNRLWQESRAR